MNKKLSLFFNSLNSNPRKNLKFKPVKSQIEAYTKQNYAKTKVNFEYLFIIFLIIYTSYFNISLQQTKQEIFYFIKNKTKKEVNPQNFNTHRPQPEIYKLFYLKRHRHITFVLYVEYTELETEERTKKKKKQAHLEANMT